MIKLEFITIRNLFNEINDTIFFYLKLPNSTLNHGNDKTNYKFIEKLNCIAVVYYCPRYGFIILKKDVQNFSNNNVSKEFLQFIYINKIIILFVF